jgi:pimeloyl-ACP methyl ester carboxylesterase
VALAARWYPGDDSDEASPCYVLAHGFTGSATRPDVVRIARQLSAADGAVLSIDFRGHGKSAGRASVGVTETVDIAAAVGWLRARHPRRPVVLLGFSMGAAVVVRYSGLHPGVVDAVIAISGPGRWYVRTTTPMRRLNRGLETLSGRWALAAFLRTTVDRSWTDLPASPVELAGAITCPALIVHGDADPYFGLEHPRMLAAQIAGSQLWIEPGMGHAESAVGSALLERIERWARAACPTLPGNEGSSISATIR